MPARAPEQVLAYPPSSHLACRCQPPAVRQSNESTTNSRRRSSSLVNRRQSQKTPDPRFRSLHPHPPSPLTHHGYDAFALRPIVPLQSGSHQSPPPQRLISSQPARSHAAHKHSRSTRLIRELLTCGIALSGSFSRPPSSRAAGAEEPHQASSRSNAH